VTDERAYSLTITPFVGHVKEDVPGGVDRVREVVGLAEGISEEDKRNLRALGVLDAEKGSRIRPRRKNASVVARL